MKIITAVLASLLVMSATEALAETRYRAAQTSAKKVQRAEKELRRRLVRLTVSEKVRIKSSFSGQDSDSDGVPDFIENSMGSLSCDTDSDDDGLHDNNDRYEREDDHDNDGQRDGDDSDHGLGSNED